MYSTGKNAPKTYMTEISKNVKKHFFFSGHENFFCQIDPKSKISYITPLLIYKKIFFRAILTKFLLVKLIFANFDSLGGCEKKSPFLIPEPRNEKFLIY